jgi:excisionase family DNA binding protein
VTTLADLSGPGAPATITVEQTAELLGISRGSGYEAVRQHELPSLRLGSRILIPVPALLRLLGAEARPAAGDL